VRAYSTSRVRSGAAAAHAFKHRSTSLALAARCPELNPTTLSCRGISTRYAVPGKYSFVYRNAGNSVGGRLAGAWPRTPQPYKRVKQLTQTRADMCFIIARAEPGQHLACRRFPGNREIRCRSPAPRPTSQHQRTRHTIPAKDACPSRSRWHLELHSYTMRTAPLSLSLFLALAAQAPALTLSHDAKSDYLIVLARGASTPEQTAAQELQAHLQRVTGAPFPIVAEESSPPNPHQILVGQSQDFARAYPHEDLPSLKHDGIILRTAGDKLYLLGGRPRGTLYAVYTFLEDVVGVRWWGSRPDETFLPTKPTLTVPDLNQRYLPQLQYREAFYRGAFDGIYAARSKCNGHFARTTDAYGGHYRILGWCHTFDQLLPPAKYFAAHPDWYSELGGKRVARDAQLCLSNPDMRRELTAQALAWLRRDPAAGMISIAQNDCGGACQCAACRQVLAEEGAESGNLLRFVNAVAEDIEKEFPGTLVETLAYTYTRTPPKLTRPRPNVIVRLCSIECSFAQPLETGQQNQKFKQDIERWSAIAPQLYIWDYVTDFASYIIPHPNLRVLAPNLRFFVNHKTIGLFEQGDAGCSCSDFPELRAWLLAHLMWDPARDDQALIRTFLQGYYGPAAEPLRQYIDLIHDAVAKANVYLPCYAPDPLSWMDLDTASQASRLFASAQERVKQDATLSDRVRRARLPLDHSWLHGYHRWKRLATLAEKPFAGPPDPRAAVDDFIRTARRFAVGDYREGAPFASYEPTLHRLFPAPAKTAPPPAEAAGLGPERWTDIQQDEFTLHLPGQCVSLVDDPKASDGLAARMPANHTQWAAQFPIPAELAAFNPWHCYLVARCQAQAKTGPAFQIGLYDNHDRKGVAGSVVQLEQAGDGQYHTFDLGAHPLRAGMYFWVAPMNNPAQVDAVYIDRIFLIRQK
jgi:hypothetical protein